VDELELELVGGIPEVVVACFAMACQLDMILPGNNTKASILLSLNQRFSAGEIPLFPKVTSTRKLKARSTTRKMNSLTIFRAAPKRRAYRRPLELVLVPPCKP